MNREFLRPRLVGRRFDEHTLPSPTEFFDAQQKRHSN